MTVEDTTTFIDENILEYRSQLYDTVDAFIEDACCIDLEQKTSLANLHKQYVTWCKEHNKHPQTKIQFGKELVSKGYEQVRDSTDRFWLGLITNFPVDMVNSPPHYNKHGIECIQAIRAALTDEEFKGYCKGNVLKYTWRENYKNKIEDLKKAEWYVSKLIESMESI